MWLLLKYCLNQWHQWHELIMSSTVWWVITAIWSKLLIWQSINQFFFLLSATSSMPLALYNGTHTLVWTHTYTYTVKYSTHTITGIHTRQPFRRRYNVFISGTHTLTLVDVTSGPRLLYSWQSISSSEESTRSATLDVPASTAPLTTYVNSAARGAAFSLQVETNPDLLRDRQAG